MSARLRAPRHAASLRLVAPAAFTALTAFAACGGHSALTPPAVTSGVDRSSSGSSAALPGSSSTPTPGPYTKIKHVVIVIQENRSFDNLFQGYPGANTVSTGPLSGGGTAPLSPVPLEAPYDLFHRLTEFTVDYDNGNMDGFSRQLPQYYSTPPPSYTPPPYAALGYVPQSEAQPYFNLAQQYVLADNMFASQLDGSFTAHQYLVAGWAGGTV